MAGTLGEIAGFDPQAFIQAGQAGQRTRTLADLGRYAANGDYQGAASAAFAGGQPDVGAQLANMSVQQHQLLVQQAASGAMGAQTPEQWASFKQQFESSHPGIVVPDFSQRQAVIAAAIPVADQINQHLQQQGLDIKRAELGIQAAPYAMMGIPIPGLGGGGGSGMASPVPSPPVAPSSTPDGSAAGTGNAPPVQPMSNSGGDGQRDTYADAVLSRMNVPQQIKDMIKGIGNYTLDPTKIASIRGNAREMLISAVQQAYPDFDMTNYGVRQQTRKAFTTGPQGQTITANRTAIHHLGQLWDDVNALGNGNWTPLNAIRNEAKTLTGNPAVTNVNTDMQAVATEVAKALRGAGAMSEGEISDWQKNFSPNASPAQMQQAIQRAIRLLGARNEMLSQAYQSGMGKQMPTFLNDEDVAVLNKMGVSPADFDPNYVKDSNGGVSGGGPKPGDVEDGFRFKGGDPSVQSNWETAN
jgi:hypothetical protein